MNKKLLISMILAAFSFSLTPLFAENNDTSEKSFVDSPNLLVSSPYQITFEGPKSGEGYFSVDGKKMIFQSERYPGNPFYQMYLMDLQTGKTDLISKGMGKTTCGWIHPLGKKLLYSSTHLDPQSKKKQTEEIETRKKPVKGRYSWSFDDQYDIFSSDLKGRNLKRLTNTLGYDAEGSYSPDGKWIAFASNRSGYTDKLSPEDKKMFDQDASYMMDIYIMKEDGTQVRRLTDAKGYDGGPFFSADGKKITWRRFSPNGATAEIYTMNIDGSEQKSVTNLKSMSWAPFYHPSGDYIVFASSVLGYSNFELFIVDSEGTKKPVRVTFNEGFDGLASFSPDGKKITWSRRNEKGESQIFIAGWDDAEARRLLGLPNRELKAGDLSPEISAQDSQSIVAYLASDKMAGRKAGGPEERIYSQKMADLFKSFGLVGGGPDGSYFDVFEFTSSVRIGEKNGMEFVGNFKKTLQIERDYGVLSFSKVGKFNEAPVVFVGFGIKAPPTEKFPAYDSYKGADVKGKWVLVFRDTPEGISPDYRHNLNAYSRIQHKVTVAKNEGAIGVVIIDSSNEAKESFAGIKFEGTLSDSSLAVLRLNQGTLKELLKLAGHDFKKLNNTLQQGESVEAITIPSVYLKAEVALDFVKSQGINVIAKLPAKGAKTAVLIGAHGDHLGTGDSGNSLARGNEKGQVHYGADDNASGVSGVMELAHYFSNEAKKKNGSLKKDLYFAIWTGEEIGVLGSSAFVKNWNKNNKLAASKYFMANLNMDMIGRLKDKLYVQGVGSGTTWTHLSEEISIRQGMPMVVQEDPYLPTDSMALYLAEIPAITFFTGAHAEYHSPRDRAETLNYPGLERVVKTVAEYTRLLSDSAVRMVQYVKVGGSQGKLEGRSFRVYLGTIPDYSQEGVKGVRISGVSKGSPADLAGLQEKDIIIEFSGVKIENIYDYVYTLQSVKANAETKMIVKRGDQTKELKITPKLKD